ncbi:hypothetical protein BKA70DRAFT_677802 [Coprinopsis sp. MPI-PUGE-AT-0042]|nr:hypothetical protein BKA70DRAFT_677802 [Coprinopsis sp. MPI-PUGE-AT-0042]
MDANANRKGGRSAAQGFSRGLVAAASSKEICPSLPIPFSPIRSTPNLNPSPTRMSDSLADSPCGDPPLTFAQCNSQGTLDAPVTLLATSQCVEYASQSLGERWRRWLRHPRPCPRNVDLRLRRLQRHPDKGPPNLFTKPLMDHQLSTSCPRSYGYLETRKAFFYCS